MWTETINHKFENIIKSKFALIFSKISHLLKNKDRYESLYNLMLEELNAEKEEKIKKDDDKKFFEHFDSKVGVTKDIWDSDYDIFTESKKKVLIYQVLL